MRLLFWAPVPGAVSAEGEKPAPRPLKSAWPELKVTVNSSKCTEGRGGAPRQRQVDHRAGRGRLWKGPLGCAASSWPLPSFFKKREIVCPSGEMAPPASIFAAQASAAVWIIASGMAVTLPCACQHSGRPRVICLQPKFQNQTYLDLEVS